MAALTLLATIVVSIVVARGASQISCELAEQERSQFAAYARILRGPQQPTSQVYWVELRLINQGPASTLPFTIELDVGGPDIQPLDSYEVSLDSAADAQDVISDEPQDSHERVPSGECFARRLTFFVTDPLHKSQTVAVTLPFVVLGETSAAMRDYLRSDSRPIEPLRHIGFLAIAPAERLTTDIVWSGGDAGQPLRSGDALLGAFVRSISINGSNSTLSERWEHERFGCEIK